MARIIKPTGNAEDDKIALYALGVLNYLLDGAIEREDDGGFVTVTILKQKFDLLRQDYERILDGEERA